jgi:hypothetical protein
MKAFRSFAGYLEGFSHHYMAAPARRIDLFCLGGDGLCHPIQEFSNWFWSRGNESEISLGILLKFDTGHDMSFD